MNEFLKRTIRKFPFLYEKMRFLKQGFRHFLTFELKNLVRHGVVQLREFIIIPNKKIIYLNNPKVACSSIRSTFVSEHVKDDNSIHTLIGEYSQSSLHDLEMKDSLNNIEKNYFKFTFVRDPFSRLASCYESKYNRDTRIGLAQLDFDDYLLGYLRENKGFESFIRKVARIPDFLADRHFMSQHYLIYGKHNNCLVDYVGKYENLQEDFSIIKEKFGLQDLPHLNKAITTNWMDYFTLDTVELVRKRYARDIELFGYEDTYYHLIDYLKNKKQDLAV